MTKICWLTHLKSMPSIRMQHRVPQRRLWWRNVVAPPSLPSMNHHRVHPPIAHKGNAQSNARRYLPFYNRPGHNRKFMVVISIFIVLLLVSPMVVNAIANNNHSMTLILLERFSDSSNSAGSGQAVTGSSIFKSSYTRDHANR